MTNLVPFSFDGWPVRVVQRDGQPWWVLSDVCRALEIGNPAQAATRLDSEDRDTLTSNEGIADARVQALTVVNESGLYALILTSRKEAAKRFKRWVTSEVLPAIRRTGAYGTPTMDLRDPTQLARAAVQLMEMNRDLQAQVGDLTDRNAALEHRLRTDTQVARRVDTLRIEVERLAKAVGPAIPSVPEKLVAAVDLLEELGIPQQGRGDIVRLLPKLLKAHALSLGTTPVPDPAKDRLLFQRSVVNSWRRAGGDQLLAEYRKVHAAQPQLPLAHQNQAVTTQRRRRSIRPPPSS